MEILFTYDTKVMFDAFPAFRLFPSTVAECIFMAVDAQLKLGADPHELFAFIETEVGMLTLADLVFDGFHQRESG